MRRSAKQAFACCLGMFFGVGAVHAQPGNTNNLSTPAEIQTLEPVGEQQQGLWVTNYGTGRPFFNVEDVQFKPWTKGLFDARQQHDLEPHARCKASGAIRQFLTPYGVEIVQIEELNRVYIFDIGGPHTYREVFMDGRSHPTELIPSNYGHNVGWWDGGMVIRSSSIP